MQGCGRTHQVTLTQDTTATTTSSPLVTTTVTTNSTSTVTNTGSIVSSIVPDTVYTSSIVDEGNANTSQNNSIDGAVFQKEDTGNSVSLPEEDIDSECEETRYRAMVSFLTASQKV